MLYLIATPIGNMGDISLRALETLRAVDLVASEDTRKTGIFLKHFDIKKPHISFYEHNEERAIQRILDALNAGQSVGIVSNAGTPGISDPGFTVVRAAIENNISFTMIPGANAVTMAVVLSGLPSHSFTFRGFPPRKQGARKRFIEIDAESPHTLVFYESPHRLTKFLADALEIFGDRQIAVANDLTKRFEHVARGPISEILKNYDDESPRGEYTIVIAGKDAKVNYHAE